MIVGLHITLSVPGTAAYERPRDERLYRTAALDVSLMCLSVGQAF